MSDSKEIHSKIDDYEHTIHASVGFMNFFRYDGTEKRIRDDVIVFQGRRFDPSPGKSINQKGERVGHVTPDIAILLPSKNGVIGEVKKSFPANRDLWYRTFNQLMSYDDDLTGWPTDNEKVASHDIVLILHQSRSVAVQEFYENYKGTKIEIKRPFSIVEFNRSDEAKQYYFFRRTFGKISEKNVDEQLKYGVQVPMSVFNDLNFKIKLCDDEPPLPYLLEIIWIHVALQKASEDERLEKLRKNQKIEIELDIETIIETLYRGFSFRLLYDEEATRQPRIPKREWVIRACKKLVELNEAKWIDKDKKITFYFRQYDDVLEHFIEGCLDEDQEDKQLSLFEDE